MFCFCIFGRPSAAPPSLATLPGRARFSDPMQKTSLSTSSGVACFSDPMQIRLLSFERSCPASFRLLVTSNKLSTAALPFPLLSDIFRRASFSSSAAHRDAESGNVAPMTSALKASMGLSARRRRERGAATLKMSRRPLHAVTCTQSFTADGDKGARDCGSTVAGRVTNLARTAAGSLADSGVRRARPGRGGSRRGRLQRSLFHLL